MARDDHYGYFSGSAPSSGSVTGDNVTYSVYFYNDTLIATAAMRYIRYLSSSEHSKYAFDGEAIGVFGNSKGGWSVLLGEENPEELLPRRIADGFSGKTRYEVGKTEAVGVIGGGEKQPWLDYNGVRLDSGADLMYSSCGGGAERITANHCPMFISCNIDDATYYGTSNQFVNICRNLNVPALWFEVPLGHTLTSGKDVNYGVDTYDALFSFANYYLKGESVEVIYAHRNADYSGIPSNAPITVKFNGAVSYSEISKITLKDSLGNTVNGSWSSRFGNTEWTLKTPTLKGDTTYTLTVPQGLYGDNGKGMDEEFILNFETGHEISYAVNSVTTGVGAYYYFTMPDISLINDFDADLFTLRLNVSNDAVNRLEVYSLSGFNTASPDSARVGELVKAIAVNGKGQYDCDLGDAVKSVSKGTTVAFLVKQTKSAGSTVTNLIDFNGSTSGCAISDKITYSLGLAPDGANALKIESAEANTDFHNPPEYSNAFYESPTRILTCNSIIKSSDLAQDDLGRTFKISVSIYDTVSRIVTLKMNSLSKKSTAFADYNAYYFNFNTKANEWSEFEFEYTVYEPEFEATTGTVRQYLELSAPVWSEDHPSFYVGEIRSVEIVTDTELSGAELLVSTTNQNKNPLETVYGTIPDIYENEEEYPFAAFSDGSFVGVATTLNDALAMFVNSTAYSPDKFPKGDYAILVRDDATVSTQFSNLSFIFGELVIDLDNHTLTLNKKVFYAVAKRAGKLNLTVKNGCLLQGAEALVSYGSVENANYKYQEYGAREFNFVFDNVTVGYSAGAAAKPFVTTESSPQAIPVNGSVLFKDCTFDLAANTPGADYTIFNLTVPTGSSIDVDVSVRGGEIKANSLDNITLESSNEKNTFSFDKNEKGSFTTMLLPTGVNAPSGEYMLDGKLYSFAHMYSTDDGEVYTLQLDARTTPYGIIPKEYASLAEYPFVSFYVNADGSYTFGLAEKDIFQSSSPMFIAARTVKTVIYLRRDYTVQTQFYNYGFCTDNIIDLGGNTITFEKSNPMTCKIAQDKKITFKNGYIKASGQSLFKFEGNSGGVGYTFYLVFENIRFDISSNAKSVTPILEYINSTYSHGADITFNNCEFYISGALPASGIKLFGAGDASNGFAVNVKVNGGKIVTDTLNGVTLTSVNNISSSVKFGKYDGEYTVVESDASTFSPSYKVLTDNEDNMIFALASLSDSKEIYCLIPLSESVTEYGNIPYKYSNSNLYPFVQFEYNKNGSYTFVGAESDIFPPDSALMINARSKDTVILMRRDFVKSTSSSHTNLCWIPELTLDMGGNTLYVTDGTVYSANIKNKSITSNLIFKNGTVSIVNGQFITFESTMSADNGFTFNVTFDGIAFEFAEGATSKQFVSFKDGVRNYEVNLTYNNCTFDLKNAPNQTVVLFEAGSKDGKVRCNTVVNGGHITNANRYEIALVNNNSSSFRFGRGSKGEYITLSVVDGASASTDVFYTVSDSKVRFDSVDGSEFNYTLQLAEPRITGVYLNLTQDINVCYTVSIPEDYSNPYMIFEFNGKIYKATSYTINDGKTVFSFTGLAPHMIGDDIKATLYATSEEGVEESHRLENYSVLTYCVNMLGKTTDVDLINLLSDLLVCGAKAQIYVNYKTDKLVTDGLALSPTVFEEVSSTNKAIMGDKSELVGWKGVSLRYENAMALKFTFRAAEHLTLKITINDRTSFYKVSELTPDENGIYTVYFRGIFASEYDDLVSACFYVDDVSVGEIVTYSVNSYVHFAQNSNDVALAELVKATYNYGVSAKKYSVMKGN